MKVQRASYQRGEKARFILELGEGPNRLQVDALGQVAQAMSRVFKPGAEIALEYTDDLISFIRVDNDEAFIPLVEAPIEEMDKTIILPSNIRSKLRKA